MYTIVTVSMLVLSVSCEQSCNRNTDLVHSIQYQLNLVAENDDNCDCGTKQDTRERRRIGFLCINSGNIKNADKETTVVFDKTLTNIGNGYNQNDGYFTAPVEGLYSFSWTIATNAKSTFHTYLEMNGEDLGRNAVGRVDNYSTSGSQSVMLHLVTNDTVCVKTLYSYNQRGLMHGAGLSSFSGFLIA